MVTLLALPVCCFNRSTDQGIVTMLETDVLVGRDSPNKQFPIKQRYKADATIATVLTVQDGTGVQADGSPLQRQRG
jgi:hypothetical protein